MTESKSCNNLNKICRTSANEALELSAFDPKSTANHPRFGTSGAEDCLINHESLRLRNEPKSTLSMVLSLKTLPPLPKQRVTSRLVVCWVLAVCFVLVGIHLLAFHVQRLAGAVFFGCAVFSFLIGAYVCRRRAESSIIETPNDLGTRHQIPPSYPTFIATECERGLPASRHEVSQPVVVQHSTSTDPLNSHGVATSQNKHTRYPISDLELRFPTFNAGPSKSTVTTDRLNYPLPPLPLRHARPRSRITQSSASVRPRNDLWRTGIFDVAESSLSDDFYGQDRSDAISNSVYSREIDEIDTAVEEAYPSSMSSNAAENGC